MLYYDDHRPAYTDISPNTRRYIMDFRLWFSKNILVNELGCVGTCLSCVNVIFPAVVNLRRASVIYYHITRWLALWIIMWDILSYFFYERQPQDTRHNMPGLLFFLVIFLFCLCICTVGVWREWLPYSRMEPHKTRESAKRVLAAVTVNDKVSTVHNLKKHDIRWTWHIVANTLWYLYARVSSSHEENYFWKKRWDKE